MYTPNPQTLTPEPSTLGLTQTSYATSPGNISSGAYGGGYGNQGGAGAMGGSRMGGSSPPRSANSLTRRAGDPGNKGVPSNPLHRSQYDRALSSKGYNDSVDMWSVPHSAEGYNTHNSTDYIDVIHQLPHGISASGNAIEKKWLDAGHSRS